MHGARETGTVHDRRLGLHLTNRSLAPRVLDALARLGYAMIPDDADAAHGSGIETARVRLVDAGRLDSVPAVGEAPDLRLLMIGSPTATDLDDPRIIDATRRPGRLGSVYAMIQRALERTPRRCPRVATRLSARCIRRQRRSIGAILSLSEGGCLLRTSEPLREGVSLGVQFGLPDYGLVSTRAVCRYTRGGDAGLAFSAPGADVRHTISHYVTMQLAGDDRAPRMTRSA